MEEFLEIKGNGKRMEREWNEMESFACLLAKCLDFELKHFVFRQDLVRFKQVVKSCLIQVKYKQGINGKVD